MYIIFTLLLRNAESNVVISMNARRITVDFDDLTASVSTTR